jgi:hypothetical protein
MLTGWPAFAARDVVREPPGQAQGRAMVPSKRRSLPRLPPGSKEGVTPEQTVCVFRILLCFRAAARRKRPRIVESFSTRST